MAKQVGFLKITVKQGNCLESYLYWSIPESATVVIPVKETSFQCLPAGGPAKGRNKTGVIAHLR